MVLKNKRGQIDFPLVTFIIVVVMLLLMGPIILKVVSGTLTPFATALNNTGVGGGDIASTNVTHVKNVFINFWDAILLIAFLIVILMLFMSAFLIDASPFFMILYIVMFFMTVLFAPAVVNIVDGIYDSGVYVEEVAMLGFLDFIRLNFGIIITVLGVITMIIIYAKLRFSQR